MVGAVEVFDCDFLLAYIRKPVHPMEDHAKGFPVHSDGITLLNLRPRLPDGRLNGKTQGKTQARCILCPFTLNYQNA